jgi:hypothetical protein
MTRQFIPQPSFDECYKISIDTEPCVTKDIFLIGTITIAVITAILLYRINSDQIFPRIWKEKMS